MFAIVVALLPGHALAQATAPVAEEAVKQRLTKPPKLVTFVEAEYPESERAKGATASVVLQIAIAADGTVSNATVIESAGSAFDAAAVDAARRFVFEPAEVNDKPAPIRINYRYQFVFREAAPTTGVLAGVVRDSKTKQPLAGVTLSLDGTTTAVTDAEGRFEFPDLAPGNRRVLLSRDDLKPLQTEELIVAGEKVDAIYEIELAPAEVPEEEQDDLEIVIIAPKLIKQSVSTKVEADEARRVAGTQGDVLKIVENLPGVARATAGSSQIVVWGAAPEDTRVYVDGVRMPLLYHFGGLRSVVHTDLVSSVELVPGGYGAAYGRGLGGLVVVSMKDPARDRLHGSLQLDILDASASLQGPLGDGWAFAVAGRRSHLDWVLDRVTDEDVGEFFPIPNYSDAQARLRKNLGQGEFVEVTGLLSSDEVSRAVDSRDPQGRKRETKNQNFQRIAARYRKEMDGSAVEVLPWFGLDHSSLDADFAGVGSDLTLDSTLFGLRTSWTGELADTVVATVGLDLEAVSTLASRTGSVGSPPREGDARVFGQPPSDQINSDQWDAFVGSAAPFVELDIGLFDDVLHLVPGLRFDPLFASVGRRQPRDGSGSPGVGAQSVDFELEPRLAARLALSRRATLKAAYGEYRQPPLPENLSPVFGNPLLGISKGRHVLAGGEFELHPTLGIETTVFHTNSADLAARNPLASPLIAEALQGIGAGRSYGAQFLLRRNLDAGFFGWVAYTLLRSERRDRPGASYRLFDFDQTHVLTALAAYELGRGFDLSARVRYATGYPRTPVIAAYHDVRRDLHEPVLGPKNGIRIPDFFQLDVRLAKRFHLGTSELETYLDVQNVTDRDNPEELAYSSNYAERRYVRGLPILPVVGARWSF